MLKIAYDLLTVKVYVINILISIAVGHDTNDHSHLCPGVVLKGSGRSIVTRCGNSKIGVNEEAECMTARATNSCVGLELHIPVILYLNIELKNSGRIADITGIPIEVGVCGVSEILELHCDITLISGLGGTAVNGAYNVGRSSVGCISKYGK